MELVLFCCWWGKGPGWNWFYPVAVGYPTSNRTKPVPSWSCWKAAFKPVWHTPVPSVQWIYSWWWAEKLPETCRVSCWSKFGKLVHLVGFIIKKFVTMHGHKNVKLFMIQSLCCLGRRHWTTRFLIRYSNFAWRWLLLLKPKHVALKLRNYITQNLVVMWCFFDCAS